MAILEIAGALQAGMVGPTQMIILLVALVIIIALSARGFIKKRKD